MFYHTTNNNKQFSFNSNTLTITVHNLISNTTYDVTPTEDWSHWDSLMKNHFPNI